VTTQALPSAAARQGRLWGARAEAWAATEAQQAPTYAAVLDRVGLARGQRVLDAGCGSGVFLRMAADRGATVAGLDASERLLALARRRVPDADLRLGDLDHLPFDDDVFDVVTGFNSFFFAADMVGALREAGRAARPGAPVVIQVWGRPERCALTPMARALRALRPAAPPAAPPPAPLCTPGVLEAMAEQAGLRPREAFDLSWAFAFAGDEALLRGLMAASGAVEAIEVAGEERVGAAILDALAPARAPDGGYRLENEWHVLVADAPA